MKDNPRSSTIVKGLLNKINSLGYTTYKSSCSQKAENVLGAVLASCLVEKIKNLKDLMIQ